MTVAKPRNASLILLSAGSWLTSMTISGFFLGYLLDAWLGSSPGFMIGFGILGFVGGILRIHKMLTSLE